MYLHELNVRDINETALKLSEEAYKENFRNESKILASGALYYLIICSVRLISYLPVKERVCFISNCDNKIKMFDRKDLVDYVDKLAIERYIDKDKEFGRYLLKIFYSVLTDIVVRSTDQPEDYPKTVKQIYDAKEVRNFRKYIDEIEKCK